MTCSTSSPIPPSLWSPADGVEPVVLDPPRPGGEPPSVLGAPDQGPQLVPGRYVGAVVGGVAVFASRLETIEARYQALASELTEIGFISPGSLVARETSCGRPGCRCQADPPRRHGPYYHGAVPWQARP
jgi:hypothetical protein